MKDGELREMVAALDVDQSLDGMVFRSLVGEPHGANKNGGMKIWMKNIDIFWVMARERLERCDFPEIGIRKT